VRRRSFRGPGAQGLGVVTSAVLGGLYWWLWCFPSLLSKGMSPSPLQLLLATLQLRVRRFGAQQRVWQFCSVLPFSSQ
jgi:hypothetical protein